MLLVIVCGAKPVWALGADSVFAHRHELSPFGREVLVIRIEQRKPPFTYGHGVGSLSKMPFIVSAGAIFGSCHQKYRDFLLGFDVLDSVHQSVVLTSTTRYGFPWDYIRGPSLFGFTAGEKRLGSRIRGMVDFKRGRKFNISRYCFPDVTKIALPPNIKPLFLIGGISNFRLNNDPGALRRLSDFVRSDHRLSSIASVFDGFASQSDLPKQKARADYGDPEAPLCPKCTIFGSIGRLPLSAKVAFALAFWIFAGGAIWEGLGA